MKKERLDILLVKRGLSESREKAKRSIMAGLVYVNGEKEDKPGSSFPEDSVVELRGNALPYVSRGGLKLEKAIKEFNVNPSGKICMDIGASTGGFTDCMLQNGARQVFAIDVGHGQLAWKLRNDSRVVCMEKTNIRHVTPEQIGVRPELISIDVSFISLKLVLPVVKTLLSESGEVLCLIKPQFEAGREQVGKKGVVRDTAVHREVIMNTLRVSRELGFRSCGLSFSPIKGPEGNIEYLLLLRHGREELSEDIELKVDKLVSESHESLSGEKKE